MTGGLPVKIAILTVSDRASSGAYADRGGPEIEAWLKAAVTTPFDILYRVIPDGAGNVAAALTALIDAEGAELVLTTGGTGPSPRDETPEGTKAVIAKELPGFGEQLRRESLNQTPTAILSRQTAGIRGRALIVNLPGNPAAIRMSLDAVFPAIPYCLDLIGAGRIETDPALVKSFRPGEPR